MYCESPFTIKKNLDPSIYPDGLLVPCGKCLMCRVHYRKEWTLRLIHENDYWEKSCFITLTYDNEHLPEHLSLVKHDLQCFFKRLRKSLEPDKIKYYAVGEYGEKYHRPHYHAIIFGLSPHPNDKKIIRRAWTLGRVHVGSVEPESISYVAQYIDKKFTGKLADEHYTKLNRIPIFRLVSAGIGKRFALQYADELKRDLSTKQFGITHSLPRYYTKLLDINPDLVQIKRFEREAEIIRDYTGLENTTLLEYDLYHDPVEVQRTHKRMYKSKLQKALNKKASINLRNKNF